MAHTPGPWFAFNADYQGRSDEAPIFVIGPQEFHTVARVRAGCHDDDLPAQTPANAALIAAAPDLLAGLKWIVERDGECLGDHPDILAKLRGFIAKAEGG